MSMNNPVYSKFGNLLIVDDNELFRRSMSQLLKNISDHSIDTIHQVESGEAAMQTLADKPIDCVLLDYQLPDKDGVFWLKEIVPNYPACAVIIVTGEGDEQTAVEAMKNGALDYLVKESLNEHDLLRAVINATEKKRMQLQLEEQQKKLLDAERQRAMITSLATACHHLGQPATVIMTAMDILQRGDVSEDLKEMIDECVIAAKGMGEILSKLQRLSEYRAVPYLSSLTEEYGELGNEILEID